MSRYELQTDFEAEVVEESRAAPVVVDFWAEWCGPCRILSPILEKLADEAGGRWKLVKVNTEEHPDLAARFGIRGIPAVKLWSGGEPVGEFVGALPEEEVRRWLDHHLPRPSAGEVAAAVAALDEGRLEAAGTHLTRAVAMDPDDTRARLLLSRLLFTQDESRTRELLLAIPEGEPEHDMAVQLLWLQDRLRWARGEGPSPVSPAGEGEERYQEGFRSVGEGRFEEALETWIALLTRNRKLDEDGPRRACLALFALLGSDSEVTREYRPRLASALYG